MSQAKAAASSDAVPALDARERIRHAAFRLFAEKGYTCTSVQDIADAAEVKKSILYYYFGNKEGLYQTLCSESAAHLCRFMLESLAAAGLPVEATSTDWRVALPPDVSCEQLLGALAERLLGLARENREPVRFFMAHIFAPDGDRPPVSVDEMEHITPLLIGHIVSAGVTRGELHGEPKDLERLLLGAIHYSIISHLRSPELEPLPPGLGCHIARIALRGFLAPGHQSAAVGERPSRPVCVAAGEK